MFSCFRSYKLKKTGPRVTLFYKPHKHTHTHTSCNKNLYSVVFPFIFIIYIFRHFARHKKFFEENHNLLSLNIKHAVSCFSVFLLIKVHCFPLFSDTLSLEMRTQISNESEQKWKNKQSIMFMPFVTPIVQSIIFTQTIQIK